VELPRRSLPAERWPAALNAHLPPTIRVLRSRSVPATFHARFSAKGKVYRYRVWNDETLPPLQLHRAWHVYSPVDLDSLAAAAQLFVGRHDFAAFAANRGKPEQSTARTIDAVNVRQSGRCITIECSGEGFLYKMVRLIVGALIRTATGRLELAELRQRLSSPAQASNSMRFLAPADGLYLVRVRY
jgi:tRNA pseudouridine38-40 synthase